MAADDPRTVIEARIRALYGGAVAERPRVLHVAAVWEDGGGRWFSWRPGPGAPRSVEDAFVLGLARARADAVVTTGRIVREEPDLEHRYSDLTELDAELAGWRLAVLGKRGRPRSVVLTGAGVLPRRHPLWREEAPLIATGERGAKALADAGIEGERRILRAPGLAALLEELLARDGLSTVLVEAGPTTTREGLYREVREAEEPRVRVDELMLTRLRGAELPPEVRGSAFADADVVAAQLPHRVAGPPLWSEAGRWRFERWLRAAGASAAREVHSPE